MVGIWVRFLKALMAYWLCFTISRPRSKDKQSTSHELVQFLNIVFVDFYFKSSAVSFHVVVLAAGTQ